MVIDLYIFTLIHELEGIGAQEIRNGLALSITIEEFTESIYNFNYLKAIVSDTHTVESEPGFEFLTMRFESRFKDYLIIVLDFKNKNI